MVGSDVQLHKGQTGIAVGKDSYCRSTSNFVADVNALVVMNVYLWNHFIARLVIITSTLYSHLLVCSTSQNYS